MEHTVSCLIQTAHYIKQVLRVRRRYPNYCKACDGWGVQGSSYDPSPSGVALGAGFLSESEPCARCEGNEDILVCSLCGQIMTEDGRRLCTCPQGIGLPPEPECFC